MRNLNITRIVKIIAYLALMFISTWATVESAYRLVNWPKPVIWILSIIFFSFAAYGGRLIVQSFDYSIRVNGRIKYLISGILLLAILWLGVILPTNTHTFFYKNIIKKTCIEEIKNTENTLLKLKIDGPAVIQKEKDEFEKEVNSEIANMQYEIKNVGDLGHGSKTDKIIIKIEKLLGQRIQHLTLRSNSRNDLNQYSNQMADLIREQLKIKLKEYDSRQDQLKKEIDNEEFAQTLKDLKWAQENLLEEPNEETTKILISSFALIDRYSDKFKTLFNDKSFEKINREPYTVSLENVYWTWKNFLTGNSMFEGKGFWYWIIVAILIDILGFVAFILASKTED